jgi:Co/Zn/Cd efflux system component
LDARQFDQIFVVEIGADVPAGSRALQADALDFLGDTLVYGLSLTAIGMSLHVRATAAILEGGLLGLMDLLVHGSNVWHALILGMRRAELMGLIGFLALAANMTSVLILLKYKDGDAAVRLVWLCSRSDGIGNIAVMLAALGVWSSGTAWPDVFVASILAFLFLQSATTILRQVLIERRVASGNQTEMVSASARVQ